MDSLTIAGIMVLLLFVVVVSGVFVGIGLSFLSVVGLWWISGDLDVAAKLVRQYDLQRAYGLCLWGCSLFRFHGALSQYFWGEHGPVLRF